MKGHDWISGWYVSAFAIVCKGHFLLLFLQVKHTQTHRHTRESGEGGGKVGRIWNFAKWLTARLWYWLHCNLVLTNTYSLSPFLAGFCLSWSSDGISLTSHSHFPTYSFQMNSFSCSNKNTSPSLSFISFMVIEGINLDWRESFIPSHLFLSISKLLPDPFISTICLYIDVLCCSPQLLNSDLRPTWSTTGTFSAVPGSQTPLHPPHCHGFLPETQIWSCFPWFQIL